MWRGIGSWRGWAIGDLLIMGNFTGTLKKAAGSRRAGVSGVVVLVTVLALLAGIYRGVPIADVELNDGGVWVTNGQMQLLGHLNYPSRALDGGLAVTTPTFDVHQFGNKVAVRDLSSAAASVVDTAAFFLGASGSFPTDLQVSFGGDTVAVAERETGKVWAQDIEELSSFSRDADPMLEDAGNRVVANASGDLLVVAADGTITKRVRDGAGFDPEPVEIGKLREYDPAAENLEYAAVGDQVVVLDSSTNVLHTTGALTQLPGTDVVRLQAAGPANDFVALASKDGLIYVPLNGDELTLVPPGEQPIAGNPVQPVFFEGCVYAAWTESGAYRRDCPSDLDDVSLTVPRIAQAKQMSFRTNRDVIVLNDIETGMILLVNDDMIEVDNWTQVQANLEEEETEDQEEDDSEFGVAANPEDNTPPVANPDSFGVRAGRTAWLPVLANDVDPDGDILTATPTSQPEMGPVQQVSQAEALQVVVPDNATGSAVFTYQAEDGRGGSSETQVTLTVHDWDMNEPPKHLRQPKLTISQGSSISYNVMNDWYDPDGDMVYLESAGPADDTAVEARPDGTVTIRDLGTADPGVRPIPVTMTDGRDSATFEIQLDVRQGNQNHPPIANTDHVTALVGQQVNVMPLANDSDPNGDPIRLVSINPIGTAEAVADYASGVVTLSSKTAGTEYIAYSISDNKAETTGLIRFDVLDPGDGKPPAAMPDMALLPPGGSALVDLTANDTDPMGGVLVVQSLQVPDGSGLSVQLIDHHLARISAPAGLDADTTFSYTVSNGYGTATAEVLVVPLPAQSTDQPPIAVDDTALVRAGDVTTIDVTLNDISPVQMALTVDPNLSLLEENPGGVAFVSDNKVRFRAGPESGTARITYTVRDEIGGFSSATVVIKVVSSDDPNDPPNPPTLRSRTFSGTPVRIGVPTTGVDPDGDSVAIGGIDMPAATKGSVTIGEGFFEYTPSPQASGTDVFGYSVVDQFGAVGRGLVYVGISPLPSVNQAPYASPDVVQARPDRLLAVPVTINDIDPDGDQVQVIGDSVTPVDASTTTPTIVEDNRINLTTPPEAATLRYYYDISDGRGGTARGLLTIEVSPEAPLLFPIARDDTVTVAQMFDQTSVVVDVLQNDEDPDGSNADLALASDDPGVTVTPDGMLEIQIAEQRQMVVYSITDPDGQTARAVVAVPGRVDQKPTLNSANTPARVLAGEVLELKLADYVLVRGGHSPRVTFAETVKVSAGGDGTPPVKDETTLVFKSTEDFIGDTAIQFEVTDGASPDDPEGLTAVLSIPIIVEPNPNANKPPTVQTTLVSVVAGEPEMRVNLSPMINDPDDLENAKVSVSLTGVTSPFEARVDGLTMSISVPADTQSSTPGTATIEVTDGGGEKVTGEIPLRATGSNRPLLAISPIAINDAEAGKPSTVDLTSYVTDPFAADGKPFTMVGEPVVSLGQGTATASGRTITVTPAAGFNGQLSVTFRLADATEDPARQVSGTIAVTVRDKPGAPVNVSAISPASRTAEVTWGAGPANGEPITTFEVRWSGENGDSGSQKVGQVTSTTITGLTNNVWYTFTVIATNQVGHSEASTPSNRVRPDKKPDRVGTPTGKFGDQEIQVSWPTGTTEGAPIDHYEVMISPAPGGVSVQEVKGTSMTWTGLTNGTAYSFTVVAVSVNDLSSDPSDASAPEIPAGAPFQPVAPNAAKDPVSPLPPSANLSWTAPDGNGDDAGLTYELRQSSTGQVMCSGAQTSCRVELAVSDINQTFEVRATNKSQKWSDWSPVSNAIRPFQPPSPVTGLSVTPTGQNNTVTISFAPGALNGAQPNEVTYYWQAGGGRGTISPGQSITDGAFPNGQNVSVSVYPVSNVNGETSQGDTGQAATVNAYGPPRSPSISCSGGYQSVTCNWSGGDGNGRPTSYQLTGSLSSGTGPNEGYKFDGIGFSASRNLCIQAIQEGGATGASNCASATSWAAPSFSWSDSGARGTAAEVSGWLILNVDVRGFRPGSTVKCGTYGVGASAWWRHFQVDGNGNASLVKPRNDPGTSYMYVGSQKYLDEMNNNPTCTQQ